MAMLHELIQSLVASKNQAADEVLLEALDLGDAAERATILEALIARQSAPGLGGVISRFDRLDEPLKLAVLANIKSFHHALRESGRCDEIPRRLAAFKLIALGRQGKLSHVLGESAHDADGDIAKAAIDALVGLSRWVSTETRALQRGASELTWNQRGPAPGVVAHQHLMEHRGEIEQTVARVLDIHRGKFGPELLRAALLLCDGPQSRTLAILQSAKHGGQSAMVRRLQQPPDSEHAEAFLLGATHGGLRSHFGIVFSHIDQAPVLDALLRKTHWLKDHQLQLCMRQVNRGPWLAEPTLAHDIARRDPADAARAGSWIVASGIHDALQDERLEQIVDHAVGDFAARLSLFRAAAARPRGASVALLRKLLGDSDERLVRMAAREIVRRRPPDMENMLLRLMTSAPDSVRRVISRAIGQSGFDQFWERFDRLDRATRKSAGRAMLKILPDAISRLGRRLSTGPLEQRLKAMKIAHELDVVPSLKPMFEQLSRDGDPKLRAKAIQILGDLRDVRPEELIDRLINDSDPRVRANVIEIIEAKQRVEYVPLLAEKARTGHNRERANAIKALHSMKVKTATGQLEHMLQDPRPEHRISAMWAMNQVGLWHMLREVGRLAREDPNLRVRRYALAALRRIAALLKIERKVAV